VPNKTCKASILKAQDNRCFYCGSTFGEFFMHKRKLMCALVTWDHLLPFAYSQDNSPSNFVAACRECNHIKYSLVFDSTQNAIRYVRQTRIKRRLPVFKLPAKLPETKALAEVLHPQMSSGLLLETPPNCQHCSLPIIGRPFWAKYCSPRCQYAVERQRQRTKRYPTIA
jgi:hypothetical protein